MADTGQRRQRGGTPSPQESSYKRYERTGPTAWAAWILFAGTMMMLIGSFHAIAGFVALLMDDYYVVSESGLAVNVDYTTWGWVHLILGSLVAVAGGGLLLGQTWARVVGVLFAVTSIIANMLFIAAYPWWSMIIITLDVIVIYALVVHGRELEDA